MCRADDGWTHAVKVAPSIATSFFTYELVRLLFSLMIFFSRVDGWLSNHSGEGVPDPAISENKMVRPR